MMEIDELLAQPSSIGIHGTIALTGTDFLPATPRNANEPGLERTNLFGGTMATTSTSQTNRAQFKQWVWFILMVIAALFIYDRLFA